MWSKWRGSFCLTFLRERKIPSQASFIALSVGINPCRYVLKFDSSHMRLSLKILCLCLTGILSFLPVEVSSVKCDFSEGIPSVGEVFGLEDSTKISIVGFEASVSYVSLPAGESSHVIHLTHLLGELSEWHGLTHLLGERRSSQQVSQAMSFT